MNKTLKVLHVEDSERDVALLTRHLTRAGYELYSERVETPKAMRAALETKEWDCILCDYSMPHFNALSALKLLQESGLDIPFIIISGTIGEEVAVEAMRVGAHDYLMKDKLARLAPAIERAIEEANNRRARRQAEANLRRSEAQYRRLLETTNEGVWMFDTGLHTAYVNRRLTEMLGYTAEEMVGRPALDFMAEGSHADVRQRVRRRTQGVTEQYDIRLRRKDGSDLWVIVCATPIYDERGEFTGSLSMLTDITERKRAEEALRESEEHYRSLFENNPLPMWVYDLETLAFLAVNDAAVHHYGYSREEFLSMTIKDIRPSEDVPALLGNVLKVDRGMDEAGVWRHRRKDGTVISVEITSHEMAFAGRRAELVLANDVTERLHAEEMQARRTIQLALRADVNAALAESGAEMRITLGRCAEAIVQHFGAAFARVWTLNPEENVLELQASAGMYTNIDGPHARVPVGLFQIGLIAQERQPHITNDIQSEPETFDQEWAGREGMVAFAGYPLHVEGRVVGVMTMFSRRRLPDDTLDALSSVAAVIAQYIDRKRTEEALRKSEEQFRQSQKLEAVGLLAGGIAHDFNNLLTAINGYSELALMKLKQEDPLHRNLEEIKKSGERAANLTRQLLAFSRKQMLQPRVLDLNSVVVDIEKMLRRLIGEDINLRTSFDPALGSTKADPGQIEQVVMNLAVNARDAMPAGGKLTIETANIYLDERYAREHVGVTPGRYVMLAVTDTGTGMDAETQARIFEPFFTTKGEGKGTGLGLSTVYGIVKQSGGNVWVYSEVGHGTTFKVYLPRVDEDAEEYKRTTETEEILRGTETILLAEDEEVVRTLACEILETYGYRVLEATGGGAALLICEREKEQIDLLITDVVMPELSGRQLAERLKQLRPDMRVLYMSGYTDNAIVHQGVLDKGANFIQKPFSPDALARKVREVLDKL